MDMKLGSKVAVALSGGVDSSTAAFLLREQGYDAIGIMMLLHGHLEDGITTESIDRARTAAKSLGIPFELLDLRKEFQYRVIEYYIKSHEQGLTPNPCFLCNQQIKWGLLCDHVVNQGINWLASGHYARVTHRIDGKVELYRAKDLKKDQSYVLAGLKQNQLAHAILPLGELTKIQTREIAHRYHLIPIDTKESQDLCFFEGLSQEDYLAKNAAYLFNPGLILTVEGRVVGRHSGLANYTIGQRKGLGAGHPKPIFVLRKDVISNTLIVGEGEFLGTKNVKVGKINWITEDEPEYPIKVEIKIRYRSSLLTGKILQPDELGCDIIFEEPVRDPTPGQFAVFYQGERVLGSAVIVGYQNGVKE